jgi:hypothetical protein
VINDREEFIGVSEDGLLWFGKLREMNHNDVKEIGGLVEAGDRFIVWNCLNGPPDGDPPWRKKMKFWDAMERYFGSD